MEGRKLYSKQLETREYSVIFLEFDGGYHQPHLEVNDIAENTGPQSPPNSRWGCSLGSWLVLSRCKDHTNMPYIHDSFTLDFGLLLLNGDVSLLQQGLLIFHKFGLSVGLCLFFSSIGFWCFFPTKVTTFLVTKNAEVYGFFFGLEPSPVNFSPYCICFWF